MKKISEYAKTLLKNKKIIIVFIMILSIVMNIFQFYHTKKILDYYDKVCISISVDENKVLKYVLLTVDETNGTYEGERVNGKKEGRGIYKWKDGSIYEGEFKNDMMHGTGKLIVKNTVEYEGEFSKNRKNGTGVFKFENGDVYEGNWVNDKMNGQGTYTFKNGNKYVGEFRNNMFDGKGHITLVMIVILEIGNIINI